jgi:hypothetical protein
MRSRPRVVRLGVPALIVAGLTLVALWRVGAPSGPTTNAAPGGSARQAPLGPLTTLAEILAANSVGRRASLENVPVRQITSARTLWIGPEDDRPVFVVLDPDVRRHDGVQLTQGGRVTLIGLVRPAPPADNAARQWDLDADTARMVEDGGTYLHATEIRPAS